MKSTHVYRTASSSYHHSDFTQLEKNKLESLSSIQYSASLNDDSLGDVVLISNTHTRLSNISPSILARTKLIIHSNSGYDHFIQEKPLWENIPVIIGHEIRAQAVAEYSLSALFDAFTKIPETKSWDSSRQWNRPLIADKKVGIYGFGHIGKIIFQTLSTLGAEVSIHDPYLNKEHHLKLGEFDAIIFCSSLNKSSKHLANEIFFSALKPDVVLINGARGKLIEEKSLIQFLENNLEARAYLDVFEEEPFSDSFSKSKNIIKSSHVAGVFKDLDQKIIDFEYHVLKNFLENTKENFLKTYSLSLLQNKIINGEII